MYKNKIYSSPLQEIYYDVEKSLLINVWTTVNITMPQMQEEMTIWMEKFNEKKPKVLLTNNKIGQIIVPKIQDWVVNLLFPTIIEKGVLKWGIIISDEIFSEMSVEQMFDEVGDIKTDSYQQLFFKKEDDAKALDWVSN